MADHLRVDVWSDLVCPWCHIGLRRLRRVAGAEGIPLQVVHHAFLLDPGRSSSGRTRDALASKYGAENVDAMIANAEAAARAEGLDLDLGATVACPTTTGHRLAALAGSLGRQDAMVARLMRGHFEELLDLGDHGVLARLAGEVGLPAEDVGVTLDGGGFAAEVQADLEQARRLGIRGVPFFVFGGRYAFSGAQPDEVFRGALRRALAGPAPT